MAMYASLSLWPRRRAPSLFALACGSVIGFTSPLSARAQDAPPVAEQPVPPADNNGKTPPPGRNDDAARKAMREERDALLRKRAEMDKRIRELDRQLLGEEFGEENIAPNGNGRLFVMPRSRFAPNAPNTFVLPPRWDQNMQKRMEEMQRALEKNFQNFPNFQNFNGFQNFNPDRKDFQFNGHSLLFRNRPGVNSFEFRSTNDPTKPFVFRLDGLDVDSREFDAHLESLRKTNPEREKQLRATRDQLREAEQKLKDALRTLPKGKS